MIHQHNLRARGRHSLFSRSCYRINARSYSMELGRETRLMGVINMTPDSFSGDGLLGASQSKEGILSRALAKAHRLVRDGADIIDVGGESSRPGADKISVQDEIQRVIPLIKKLSRNCSVPLSVDTYKSEVAKHALDAGASIINTIKGCRPEKSLLKMTLRYNAAIVLMHMQGTPRTMQKKTHYQNLIQEIVSSLKKSMEICLDIGIKSDKIILDPGIGFGKIVEHNLEIIRRLKEFKILDRPLLIGTSRKSFIGKILNKEDTSQRFTGTLATICASVLNGAHIIRLHDVKQIKDAVTMTDAILNACGDGLTKNGIYS